MTVPDRSAPACLFTSTLRSLGTEKIVEALLAHATIGAANAQAFSIMATDLCNRPFPSTAVAGTVSLRMDKCSFVLTFYHLRAPSLFSSYRRL